MNVTTLKDLLVICLGLGAVLAGVVIFLRITIARLKQKNYFLNRDRERYAETLYALQEGCFAFIYPDERIKDPRRNVREKCSRRLAVMLNLKQGTSASFDDVLSAFEENDALQIKAYVQKLRTDGLDFEYRAKLKENQQILAVWGLKINGADGNLYADTIWFKDLSPEMLEINHLRAEKDDFVRQLTLYQNMFEQMNTPVWLRNEKSEIILANAYYKALCHGGAQNPFEINPQTDLFLKNMAQKAQESGKTQKENLHIVVAGRVYLFEALETPLHPSKSTSESGTVGMLTDVSELDEVKRRFQIHQDAHLNVLSALGTAFALFNPEKKLVFYNEAFMKMWQLKKEFLDNTPSYQDFLEAVRDNRLLPEVSDFKSYKNAEEKLFQNLIEPQELLMHLPDGRTVRRLVAVHPNGLMFAYEDVSDRLAATRMLNEFIGVQQNILEHMDKPIVVFGADRHLRFYNPAYCRFWNVSPEQLQEMPFVSEVLDMQKGFFQSAEDWNVLKLQMMRQMFDVCARFLAERDDGQVVEAQPFALPDQSTMIIYQLQK